MRQINTFTCPNGHTYVTLQQTEGKTQDLIGCLHPDCDLNALSAFNKCDQSLNPTFEWYKPTNVKGLQPFQLEWLTEGSLILREIQKTVHDPFKGVGRNDPCPCGSGKKYKRCHGNNF